MEGIFVVLLKFSFLSRGRDRDRDRRQSDYKSSSSFSYARRHERSRSRSPVAQSSSSATIRPSLRPVKRKGELGYTGRSLNERFATKYDPLDFRPEDNISVAIERNIKGKEEAKVDVPLVPMYVVLPRSRNEGETPLTEREEFKEREEEEQVEEKRTITVKQTGTENRKLLDRSVFKRFLLSLL